MFVYALDNTIVADIIPVCMLAHICCACIDFQFQAIINDFDSVANLPWLSVGLVELPTLL